MKAKWLLLMLPLLLGACTQDQAWDVQVTEPTEDNRPCLDVLNYEGNSWGQRTPRDTEDNEPDLSGIYCRTEAKKATKNAIRER